LAEDKNFLQTIKLEISRTFKLDRYERMSFHNLLGVIKSENGRDLLIKELKRDPETRISAMANLAGFNDDSIAPVFIELLEGNVKNNEIGVILGYFEKCAVPAESSIFLNILEKLKNQGGSRHLFLKCFDVMGRLCSAENNLADYLVSVIENEKDRTMISGALMALSYFKRVDIFENILKKNDDNLAAAVFDSIYKMNVEIMKEYYSRDEKDYSPEDRFYEKSLTGVEELLLQIKVLLGRVAPRFEHYSDETRVSLVNAMLSCNHREGVIYALKGLESRDDNIVHQTLYAVYNNITRLRDPDKLFRSLLAMNILNDGNNRLVVDIFYKYFSGKKDSRAHILFRDKLYGYISGSVESFFETYRREFMIPDVVENSFPENFQKIRNFILRKLNPEIKRKITDTLVSHDFEHPRKIMEHISQWIKHIDESDKEALSLLTDLLLDRDMVSREKSAERIESVNFDKIYLQKRIIRLCMIISRLNIESAAKSLVYIYNYLKKYPEPEILESAINALCRLNYSYMLSEVEIMITAGSAEDQIKAVKILPLFTEKRLINIITEYLKNNITAENEIVKGTIDILCDLDIKSNINVISVFKEIIEKNSDIEIKRKAVKGLGNAALAEDIEYLNDIFHETGDSIVRETAVKGIVSIVARRSDYNKQHILRYTQEYLKDSSIRVRIFSCMVLIRLGNQDALKIVRDMLTIKNKMIQREIFTVLSDIQSPDFSFFLISLLKEEYGISRDIAGLLGKLPSEELKEIETFIINLFRKFEIPSVSGQVKQASSHGIEEKEITLLYIIVNNYDTLNRGLNFYDKIILNQRIDENIFTPVNECSGRISHKIPGSITAWFSKTADAVKAAEMIEDRIEEYNESSVYSRFIDASIIVSFSSVPMYRDEVADYLEEESRVKPGMPLNNMVVLNSGALEKVNQIYYSTPLPEILYSFYSGKKLHYELVSPVNFLQIASEIIHEKEEAIEKKREMEIQIESQVKSLNLQGRSTTSIAIAGELENVGLKLKSQFDEIERYVNRRSTDRELSKNVRQMLNNAYNLYRVETSKLTIK
jgi:hypothetical protein